MVQLIKNKRHIHPKDVNKDADKIILSNRLMHIGKKTFANLNISEITLPEGLKVIGNMAFFNCHNLQSIVIPNSVESIQTIAFYCTGIRNITILADNLRFIGHNAFSHYRIYSRFDLVCQDNHIYNLNMGYGDKYITVSQRDLNYIINLCINYDNIYRCIIANNNNYHCMMPCFDSTIDNIRIYESFIIKNADKLLSFDFLDNKVEILTAILEIIKNKKDNNLNTSEIIDRELDLEEDV